VDAIFGVAEIKSARSHRVAFTAGRKAWQVRLARNHLWRRMPVWPLAHTADALSARPGEPIPADADAVAQRFTVAEHQIEKGVRCVDDYGASGLGRDVGDELTADLGR